MYSPGLLFWATLFISLLHLSVTLPFLVEFSQGLCTPPLPFTDHLASSTSPATHAQVSVTSGTSSVLSPLLLLPFTHCLEAGWWYFLLQRVIIMICVWTYWTVRSLSRVSLSSQPLEQCLVLSVHCNICWTNQRSINEVILHTDFEGTDVLTWLAFINVNQFLLPECKFGQIGRSWCPIKRTQIKYPMAAYFKFLHLKPSGGNFWFPFKYMT